ncbi:MAG: molybdate ABC transporter substrate-binding protein [Deltaproteobacteria bacterium]|nr:molybdate ABC transporter substrate-binding protein [Deltaproteobacteria bacterium]
MRVLLLAATLTLACGGKRADPAQIHVAAAADLTRAFTEVGAAFKAKTGIEPVFTFGSTGLLAKQLGQGAPFDLFAAANISYTDGLVADGTCAADSRALYARGRLVVWTSTAIAPPKRLEDLADPRFAKIAIANPDHAPYGVAAKAALTKVGIWSAVEPRMVYGENVQQALQFAQSGNADAAVIALSLSAITDDGKTLAVDPALHPPLDQALVVCSHGGNAKGGAAFAAFVSSPEGREIMNRYGFLLPPAAPGSGASAAPPGARAPVAAIPESETRALIAAWLAAQNRADATAYAALYAARFTGVKRVGIRSWQYDRAGWLANRAAMFKHPMTVAADEIAIHGAGSVAIVELVQDFTQGKFHDRGPKQLVVVRTPDGLRIAREEMRASHAAQGDRDPGIGFVVGAAGARYALVDEAAALTGTGVHALASAGPPMIATEGLDPAAVPAATAARAASIRALIAPAGGCPAALGAPALVAIATPHFGTVQDWDGDGGRPALTAAERAQALTALVARQLGVAVTGPCAARWYTTAADPVVFAPSKVPADRLAEAVAGLRATAAWKQLQTEFADHGGTGDWSQGDDHATLANLFTDPSGTRSYLAVQVRSGHGCGDFAGEVSGLWLVTDHAAPLAVAPPGAAPWPAAITDVDRDGAIEVLTDTDVLVPTATGFASARHLERNDFDDPC